MSLILRFLPSTKTPGASPLIVRGLLCRPSDGHCPSAVFAFVCVPICVHSFIRLFFLGVMRLGSSRLSQSFDIQVSPRVHTKAAPIRSNWPQVVTFPVSSSGLHIRTPRQRWSRHEVIDHSVQPGLRNGHATMRHDDHCAVNAQTAQRTLICVMHHVQSCAPGEARLQQWSGRDSQLFDADAKCIKEWCWHQWQCHPKVHNTDMVFLIERGHQRSSHNSFQRQIVCSTERRRRFGILLA